MNTVEKVQALMVGEEHVRHEESKQWAVKYRTALMELAVELDDANAKIFYLERANSERWKQNSPVLQAKIDQAALLRNKPPVENQTYVGPEPKLSKAEATSIRMKAWWAEKKAKDAKKR